MKFIDQFPGQAVEVLVGHMGIVQGYTPGDKKLGEGEHIAEVDDPDDFDLEQSGGLGGAYREEEVVQRREDPPAEEEEGFLVMKFNELRVSCNGAPVILFFCHGSYSFLLSIVQ
jgi:hypothetical protein